MAAEKKAIQRVKSQSAIDLKLLFGKELITGRLMRKARIAQLIVRDDVVLVPAEGRLDIEKQTINPVRIVNIADRTVRATPRFHRLLTIDRSGDRIRCSLNGPPGQIDPYPKINPGVSLQRY